MGRSGDVGKDVEIVYDKMQDPDQFTKLLYNVVDNLITEANPPWWAAGSEKKVVEWIVGIAIDRIRCTESLQTENVLSKDAEKGLWAYMNGPLRDQIRAEQGNNMPPDVTFVFGHTHKSFEDEMNFQEYPQWVKVYNSGGWVVESVDPQPLHGGAVILIGDDLSVASLRMYNENSISSNYVVKVEEASHPGEAPSAFCTYVRGLVDATSSPWKEFSDAAARAVHVRAQNLKAEINEKT
jgi:hypothetical protein